MLTTEYELFRMKDDESIQDMYTRFTSIINELHSLGDVIPRNKLVRKTLSVLRGSWESKVNAITEAKDLQTLTMDEFIGNLKTYEMKRKKDSERREPKKEKNLGDSSSESEREPDTENSFMMAVEIEATKYDSLFALMAQADDDEDDGVNFRDIQRNLKSYSSNKLRSLANVLIDAYYSLVNNKDTLTIELGEAEQSRDDLVVCVVDLNETIANLEKEKEVLNEKITSVKNEKDNLMVVVVDLKETIECLSNGKHTLEGKIATTEQERDDLLVICIDLKETIEGLNREHRNVSLGKGKEVASESYIKLEKKLTIVKSSLCSELKKNQQLQAELEKGIRFQREKTPYNPHNKYVTVPDNWLCTHCGNNGYFKENCQARVQSVQKYKGTVKGSELQ
ncbi:uncharacterized protein [Nicotiana sylvestris]|uniref:uncharacterized protein n=1 Tax=Nicotiana sylvestris TaxID=4096 RepID=UPI00388CE037